MKSILRSVFALAFEEYWVTDNVYLRVSFQKYDGMLIKEIPIENRCHSWDCAAEKYRPCAGQI